MKVKNYTYREYLGLHYKTEVDWILRNGTIKPKDIFKLGDFLELDFGFVKDIQDLYNFTGMTWQSFFEEISKFKKIEIREITEMSIFDLQSARLFCLSEIEKINKLERQNLNYGTTGKEEVAGIDKFSKYRSFIQFDSLAGGDITKFEEIRKQPYNVCFTKLLYEKDRADYEKQLKIA